jgi:hypothetical protein
VEHVACQGDDDVRLAEGDLQVRAAARSSRSDRSLKVQQIMAQQQVIAFLSPLGQHAGPVRLLHFIATRMKS